MKQPSTKLARNFCALVCLFLISTLNTYAQYCNSESTDAEFEWITNVTFAGIDNDSESSDYSDFTDITGSVAPGLSYEFSGTLVQSFIGDPEYIQVWIDWNQDEIFSEGERTQIGDFCTSSNCTLTSMIDVPANAPLGETRMRVILSFNGPSDDPCVSGPSGFDGEVEDYSLLVEVGDCTPPDLTFTTTNNCSVDTYEVSSVIEDYGSNTSVSIIVTRSDGVPASNVNLLSTTLPPGSTVPIINNVPFGVSIFLSIEGQNPICNITRNFSEEICPPANDEACTATPLVCGDVLNDLLFEGATQSVDDACAGSGAGDVWFTFVADGTQIYFIAETQSDVVVDLWSGDDCGNLTSLSACADFDENFTVTEAGTYYFRIRPYSTATTYGVSLTCTPFDCPGLGDFGDACDDGNPNTVNDLVSEDCVCAGVTQVSNDEPCTAIALACNDTLADQTFIGATVSIEDDCTNSSNGDVWYSFTAMEGMAYQINEPSPNSTTASLYIAEDGDCETLTEVISCTTSFNTFIVTEPGDYFFRIRASSSQSTHSVGLICAQIPPNDECSDALPLICGDTYAGSTLGSSAYPAGQPFCDTTAPTSGNGGVWYTITPDNDTEIDLDLSGSGFDTKLFLYLGTCDALVCVAGNDDAVDLQSQLDAVLTAGITYYVFVTGFGSARGEYLLNVSCVDLECSPTIESALAVDAQGELLDCVDLNGEYFLQVTLAGGTQASYNVSAGDSPVTVIDADGTGIVGPVSGTDVTVNATGTVNLNCGATFDYVGTPCPPSNDEACNATPISCGETIAQNYEGATLSETCGTGSGVADVWFIFTADGTQTYTIADVGPGFLDAAVGLYQGDDCENLVSVAPCADTPESYSVTEAGTYYFYIRPWSIFATNLIGNVSLTCTPFECPGIGNVGLPCDDGDAGTVNDVVTQDCECVGEPVAVNNVACTATQLECGDALTNLPFAGSSQSFDDDCFGSGTGDVWFSFIADGTQAYEVAETSSSDVVVDLWIGDDCGNLTNVSPCNDFIESVQVSTAGIYYFRIRPYSTATTYAVSLSCTAFECPGLGNIGSPCDDGDPTTSNDLITADCECVGEPIPDNNECADAIEVSCGDFVTGTTRGASENLGCDGDSRQTVWYSFTAGAAGDVLISTCNAETNFDTDINVYTGACDDLTCFSGFESSGYVDGNFDCEPQSFAGVGTLETEAGVTYYIAITGFYDVGSTDAWEGEFGLSIECASADAAFNGSVNWNSNCDDRISTVTFYEPNTSNVAATYETTVNSAGEFTIPSVLVGTYDIIVDVPGYLNKGLADVVTVVGENTVDFGPIRGGDANDSNSINIADFSGLNAAFGSVAGDANYNLFADFNCSGTINIADFSGLNAGFGQGGANAPLP